MDQTTVPVLPPIWGAVLSTFLALLKVREVFQQRIKLSTSYDFSSDPTRGSTISIENASSTPAMVTYYELVWCKGGGFKKKQCIQEDVFDPDEGYVGFTVAPHSVQHLHFCDEHNISWGSSMRSKGSLFIKLYLAGKRRPLYLKVYDPSI